MDNEIHMAIIGLLGAIIASKPLMEMGDRIVRYFTSKDVEHTYIKMMEYRSEIQQCMKDIRTRTNATRVVSFAGHNGGGLPRPSSRYYTTAVQWDVDPENESRVGDYKGLSVDNKYIDILLACHQERYYLFKTETEKDSQLRRVYESEGVVESMIFFLDVHENNFLYCSVATLDPKGFDLESLILIEILATKMRGLTQQANKLNDNNSK